MKSKAPCFHGCPGETWLKCWCYNADGTICGKEATVLDPARGCYVCELHGAHLVHSLVLEAVGFKPLGK